MKQSFNILGALICWPLTTGLAAEPEQLTQGQKIFTERCVVCHGQNADGKSPLGNLMNPHPANLRASTLTTEQRNSIVRKGGLAVGRSNGMPAWEKELSDAEISAVVIYVASLRQTMAQSK